MQYQEFNRISGKEADANMYFNEIEPTYMTFDWMTKEAMVTMYWGEKKGAYELWTEGNTLYKEKYFMEPAIQEMRKAGLVGLAKEYADSWNKKAAIYRQKVELMMA